MAISIKTIIGAGIGWAILGPIGAIIGGIIGSKLDDDLIPSGSGVGLEYQDTRPGDFYTSLIIIFSHVIRADHKVRQEEIQFVKRYLSGTISNGLLVQELMTLLQHLLERPVNIREVAAQIARYMDFPSRIQLIHLLFGLSLADRELAEDEKQAIREISLLIGLSDYDYQSIYSSYHREDTDAAYRILEVSPDADDEEIRKAYKKQAVLNHPDKVAHLGPDVVKKAEEKFKIINEAYSSIKKARGI